MKKIFFVTGETSGDMHAASLLNELYKIIPKEQMIAKAIGGSHLKDAGADIFFNSKHLASIGITEVISRLFMYLNLERELLFQLFIFRPDVLVLIDFPGFNLRIAKKVKTLLPDTKIVYYLPPQVWAWNQRRTKILAKYCDLVLCGLPFEEKFHKGRGVNACYVGSPILHELEKFDREKIRSEFGIKKEDLLIGLFPGSRKSEIYFMLPVLLKASELLHNIFPQIKFLIAQAPAINLKEAGKVQVLLPGNNYKLLCASDILWLTSGTVTLEAALYETPMILGYRGNMINYFLYLLLKRINMVGLPNIIYGEKIVPELLQNQATPENYYEITKNWLKKPEELEKIKKLLKTVKEKITDKNASREAALKIRELIPEYKVFVLK
ncbi:MAG: lipid-A-disaccharide synthase [Candidatus Melainabacteria bacterium RIFCSPLOWO2_12_FULL_35_11]|nr:MAG: lipid-A-disaccharide synthase [Candidatus Melainabacteria bacterium RIFCSPLOWO2_12_FULL_35_11]